MEMSEKLQEQLWAEASAFVENSSRKNLARFGVTLDGNDDQYMELAFTCPCDDEGYDVDTDDIYNQMLIIENAFEEKLGGD